MEINAYQIPEHNNIYIQQNLFKDISQNKENNNFYIFFEQGLSFKRVSNKNILPITSELGVELNHNFQASLFCSSTFQNFHIDNEQTTSIQNLWYCGNSFAIIPYASSIFHPKLKIYGGAGQAFGTEQPFALAVKNTALYFWTLKPVLLLETNISKNIKFSLGVGYQFIFSNTSNNLTKNTSGFEGISSFSYYFK